MASCVALLKRAVHAFHHSLMIQRHLHNDEKQCKSVVVEDSVSSLLEVLSLHDAFEESLKGLIFKSSFDSLACPLDELVSFVYLGIEKKWSYTSAFNKEHVLASSKRRFGCDEINGMEKVRSWRKTPAEAIEGVVLTYLMAQIEVVPCSAFFWYPVHFSNLQKLKGISWKAAAASASAKISVHPKFTSSISAGDHYEDMDLHLAFSTSQIQSCTKMSSSTSNRYLRIFISNPRACESDDIRYLNPGCIEGLHPTLDMGCYGMGGLGKTSLLNKIKTIHQAPSAPLFPTSELALANHYTARKTSTTALLVTICVVSTFVAALGFSSSSFKEAHLTGNDATTSRSIIAMNSLVFIVSLVTDMFLLNEFTYKWELQVALFALFGAYICLMKVMIPQAALPMLLLSVPFLLFAAAEGVVVPYAGSSR